VGPFFCRIIVDDRVDAVRNPLHARAAIDDRSVRVGVQRSRAEEGCRKGGQQERVARVRLQSIEARAILACAQAHAAADHHQSKPRD
jgi:hypothetical protein